ncbi:MAG TPA: hypothetical protein VEU28_01470 [Actinomycetota bacterium]|nr:hypothetical protein [Actinomycetota bacterium]
MAGAAIAAGTLAVYGTVIAGEGNNTFLEVAPFLMPAVLATLLAAAGVVYQDARRKLAIVAGALLLVLGLAGILSIGLLLLAAAACCFWQVARISGGDLD